MKNRPLADTVKHVASQPNVNQHGIALNDPTMSLLVRCLDRRFKIVSVYFCHELCLAFCGQLCSKLPPESYHVTGGDPEAPRVFERKTPEPKWLGGGVVSERLRARERRDPGLGDFEILFACPGADADGADDHVLHDNR